MNEFIVLRAVIGPSSMIILFSIGEFNDIVSERVRV